MSRSNLKSQKTNHGSTSSPQAKKSQSSKIENFQIGFWSFFVICDLSFGASDFLSEVHQSAASQRFRPLRSGLDQQLSDFFIAEAGSHAQIILMRFDRHARHVVVAEHRLDTEHEVPSHGVIFERDEQALSRRQPAV